MKKASPFKFKKRGSFPLVKAAAGMKVEGPSHEDGGINANTPDGKPVAEIEGGERIFSKEDTAHIEQAVKQIISMGQSSPDQAQKLATALGFEVVKMVLAQEKNQKEQEGSDTEQEDQANGAMNSFANTDQDDDTSYTTQ